jgi:hypothetical protein
MSATFTQLRRTIDLAEKVKVDSGEKIVKTEKVGRKKNIEVTLTTKSGKFFVYFDGEKYAGQYRTEKDAEKVVKDYLKLVGEELEENRAKRDAFKAMGLRRGKDAADVDNDATDDDRKSADKNIMVQLRKVVTMRGMKPVEFADGKKAKINPRDAERILSIYDKLKPASKLQLQTVLAKSKRQFDDAVKQLAKFEEVELDEAGLPPHLAKLFDKDGNFKDPKKQKIFNRMMGDGIGKEIAQKMGRIKFRVDADSAKKTVKVYVDSNDEKDAQRALKMHPAYISGNMRVIPEESVNEEKFAGWIAIYKGKKLEIKKSEAESIYGAKLKAIKDLKVPKSQQGLLAIKPAYEEFVDADLAKQVREEVELDEAMKTWEVKVTKGINKLKAGTVVKVKARNASEAMRKAGKEFGDPIAVKMSGYFDAKPIKEELDLTEESKTIAKVRDIVKTKGATKVDGFMVDTFSASAIIQIYDKVNDANKAKMDKMKVDKLADLAFKLMRKMREEVEVSLDEMLDLEEKYTAKQYKMAFGVLNDPRWKGGNMTRIVNTIEKIAKGLSKDKAVAKAIQLTNEEVISEAETETAWEVDVMGVGTMLVKGKNRNDIKQMLIKKFKKVDDFEIGKVRLMGPQIKMWHRKRAGDKPQDDGQELDERELTPAELKNREKIAKDLPDAEFKKRYGDKWMQVKMGTATNMAKGES